MGNISALLSAIAAGEVDGAEMDALFRAGLTESPLPGQMGLPDVPVAYQDSEVAPDSA